MCGWQVDSRVAEPCLRATAPVAPSAVWAAVLALSGRYDRLYTYVIYGMVLSYTLTVIAMFWLRWKRPEIPRPYRCTGYPWLPAIYVLIGTAWTVNTIVTRPIEAFGGTVVVLIGVPKDRPRSDRTHLCAFPPLACALARLILRRLPGPLVKDGIAIITERCVNCCACAIPNLVVVAANDRQRDPNLQLGVRIIREVVSGVSR